VNGGEGGEKWEQWGGERSGSREGGDVLTLIHVDIVSALLCQSELTRMVVHWNVLKS